MNCAICAHTVHLRTPLHFSVGQNESTYRRSYSFPFTGFHQPPTNMEADRGSWKTGFLLTILKGPCPNGWFHENWWGSVPVFWPEVQSPAQWWVSPLISRDVPCPKNDCPKGIPQTNARFPLPPKWLPKQHSPKSATFRLDFLLVGGPSEARAGASRPRSKAATALHAAKRWAPCASQATASMAAQRTGQATSPRSWGAGGGFPSLGCMGWFSGKEGVSIGAICKHRLVDLPSTSTKGRATNPNQQFRVVDLVGASRENQTPTTGSGSFRGSQPWCLTSKSCLRDSQKTKARNGL